ncbi:TetR/AcrR family transcriptional regulator [Pseudonocardia sp. TRM90224]|uniref:TetR/AcrR family transcriptional regulator n=1 Tax=Pseudonocardia sp. TRM90224 TaxID=2812678 RepID=UPI001E38B079|nr:TetR/AcrR family transcriptional regulator [Pseudonocardia sp. TRM90224]
MPRTKDLAGQQERLSAATWSVLAERGVRGLTLRAVAERAGCTTGLVLHTFPDKQALLAHARELLHRRTAVRLDAIEVPGADPDAVLRAVLLSAASLDAGSREEASVWLSFIAEALSDAELARQHVGNNRSLLARVQRLVSACRPGWTPARCRQSAAALIALVEGMNTLAALDPESYSPAVQEAAIGAALVPIVGADGAGV